MKLLVCAATSKELTTFLRPGEALQDGAEPIFCDLGHVTLAETGVGIPLTLMRLPPLLAAVGPDLVVNIGIAGAYPCSGVGIGSIVMARTEVFGDIGFELPCDPGFRPISESLFGAGYERMTLECPNRLLGGEFGESVHEVDACTVNCCTGTAITGTMRETTLGVQVESMEGAAVALACRHQGVPICEIRAISNIASDRDMQPEGIRLALQRLNSYWIACRDSGAI